MTPRGASQKVNTLCNLLWVISGSSCIQSGVHDAFFYSVYLSATWEETGFRNRQATALLQFFCFLPSSAHPVFPMCFVPISVFGKRMKPVDDTGRMVLNVTKSE